MKQEVIQTSVKDSSGAVKDLCSHLKLSPLSYSAVIFFASSS